MTHQVRVAAAVREAIEAPMPAPKQSSARHCDQARSRLDVREISPISY